MGDRVSRGGIIILDEYGINQDGEKAMLLMNFLKKKIKIKSVRDRLKKIYHNTNSEISTIYTVWNTKTTSCILL